MRLLRAFVSATLLLVLGFAAHAQSPGQVQWGISNGALCVLTGGSCHFQIGTYNGVFTPSIPNGAITAPLLATGAAVANIGFMPISTGSEGIANGIATLDSGAHVPLSQIPPSIANGLAFEGNWNASTNSPALVSSVGTVGQYYFVSVAGSTSLNGTSSWAVGDLILFSSGIWNKIPGPGAGTGVSSVVGLTGAVGSQPLLAALSALPHVANNTALATNPTTATPVVRDGFAAAGDGGRAIYTYSVSACSAADGGAQVSASGGGCWIADLSAIGSTNIKLWGAPTDGVNDDTAAATLGFTYLNSKGGGKLYLPGGVKVVFNALLMSHNGLSIECPWTDATQILPASASGNAIVMGSGTGGGATPVADLEVNNCTFVPAPGASVQTGGSYVVINNANTTRLTNTRHFGGFMPILISGNSVVNYVTTTRISNTASTSGVSITVAAGTAASTGNDQYITDLVVDGAGGTGQPAACINIQNSGAVWMRDVDCIAQGNGLLISPGAGQEVTWTFGSNIAFDTGFIGLNVTPAAGGIVKGLQLHGLWTSSNTNYGAAFTGAGSIDTVELFGHRSLNNGRDGMLIAVGSKYTINGGAYCGNSATTPGSDSGIDVVTGMQNVSILNVRNGACVGYGATQARSIILQPSATTNNILIANNDLTGSVTAVFDGVTTPNRTVIFANNIGYDPSWISYTPTVTGATGLTSAAGFYQLSTGKIVTVRFDILWGTAGAPGASLTVSLPVTGKAGFEGVGCGREIAIAGTFFCGTMDTGATHAVFQTASNGNPIITNGRYTHTFTYEAN